MFEFPSGITTLDHSRQPSLSVSQLEATLGAKILRRSTTVWQEHCSECAMPSCYATCNFYRPRLDYKCQRFDFGLQVASGVDHVAIPVQIKFGKWARLVGHGPAGLGEIKKARQLERRALIGAEIGGPLTLVRGLSAPIRRRMVNVLSRPHPWGDVSLERLYVVIETISSAPKETELLFSFRFMGDSGVMQAETFKTAVTVPAGYSVHTVAMSTLMRPEDVGRHFAMEIWPADPASTHEITFGLLEIAELDKRPSVAHRATSRREADPPKLKCVVWDLDNTLWSGVLVENGIDGIRLNEEAAEAVRTLDSKGILQSIASKNDLQDALDALKKFDLDHFFIAPQISWGPKSDALRRLQKRLNIGLDTFALIDDQIFEREEVTTAYPEVAAFDPRQISALMTDARLDVPVTAESTGRRLLYKSEDDRLEAQGGFSGPYEEFLRSCSMSVRIAKLAAEHVDRAYELAQRTNQLNISGYRYSREEISELVRSPGNQAAFVISAQDKFGSYGLIGFVVFDRDDCSIKDLMFSCRIQGKLVDDAFVAWLYETTMTPAKSLLHARFKQTKKNTPARQLLERLGFHRTATTGEFETFTKNSANRDLADIRKIISVDVSDT